MASACPTDTKAIDDVINILNQNADTREVVTRIKDGEGILLRSGKRLPSFKKGGKWSKGKGKGKGGMFSRNKRPAEMFEESDKPTPRDKSAILNGLAHIITASIIASGVAMSVTSATCYIKPSVSAFLASWGWLPTLCSETPMSLTDPSSWFGGVSWAMQEIKGYTGLGNSCLEIKEQHDNLINWSVNIVIGLVSGGGVKAKYMAIKDTLYDILDTIMEMVNTSAELDIATFVEAINTLASERDETADETTLLTSFVEVAAEKADIQRTPEPRQRERERTPLASELMPNSAPATPESSPEPEDMKMLGGKRSTKKNKKRSTIKKNKKRSTSKKNKKRSSKKKNKKRTSKKNNKRTRRSK